MSNATLRRNMDMLLRERTNQWAITPISSPVIPPLYWVAGGNVLPSGQSYGLVKRADAVLASEFAAGTGGSSGDIVQMAPWPVPTNLPMGAGVGQHVITGAYGFVVLDSQSSFISDLPMGYRFLAQQAVSYDVVAAGVTYRYTCLIVITGF